MAEPALSLCLENFATIAKAQGYKPVTSVSMDYVVCHDCFLVYLEPEGGVWSGARVRVVPSPLIEVNKAVSRSS